MMANKELLAFIQAAGALIPDDELLGDISASNSVRSPRIGMLAPPGTMEVTITTFLENGNQREYRAIQGPKLILVAETKQI